MPVYFIRSDQVRESSIHIDGVLARHLQGALRCGIGETLHFADDTRGYTAVVRSTRPLICTLLNEAPLAETRCNLRLGLALLKGDPMDWAIQKATELGVQTLVPLITQRTIARPPLSRREHQQQRWQSIALEAAQQVGRSNIPRIQSPQSFEDFLNDSETHPGFQLCFWEGAEPANCAVVIHAAVLDHPRSGTLIIGPEGGFDPSEVGAAKDHGFKIASLGPRIMRADTAAVAALSILQYEIERV